MNKLNDKFNIRTLLSELQEDDIFVLTEDDYKIFCVLEINESQIHYFDTTSGLIYNEDKTSCRNVIKSNSNI